MNKQQKRSLAIIFVTVFMDLVGFGIILPIIPYLGKEFQASDVEIGVLMALFSLMQFAFSPFWGKLSDRVGRRPVILISLFGMTFAYIMFAFARDLTTLFIARTAAGFFAANISTAQAYIADITPKEKRSIGMGMIGAAFGLGFIVGPVIGAFAAGIGESLGSQPPFGMQFSTIVAAGLNLVTLSFAFFMLPETLDKSKPLPERHSKGIKAYSFVFSHKQLSPLMTIFLLQGLAMALMEVMLFVFVKDRFGWNHITAGYAFAYIGVIMVLVQGYFIRKWIPRFGEKKVLLAGLLLMTLGFFAIGPSHSIPMLGLANTLLAIGVGCMRPPIMGIASVITSDDEQGFVMGVMQSMAAIGRIFGPLAGGWLYQYVAQSAPFYAAALLAGASLLVFVKVMGKLPNPQGKAVS